MTTSKKKKKSARERRVLVASIICAGLIVASSTFAWFTSTDDVTNRLSASADYGVSIVESFEPPANWIPGQTVNKDVYDVNTGNIGAFVNNDISGKLTYSYETTVSAVDKVNGVKLIPTALTEIDGATTMEGGSFLAWTNTTEPLGVKNSARIEDGETNHWTPSKNGIYIFRRAISGTTYYYAGYYYEEGVYYKISIGNDENPNNENVFDVSSRDLGGTAVIDEATGAVKSGKPSVKYVIETKVENADVTYEFDSVNKRLIFKYSAAVAGSGTETYDASAAAARAEVDYENAKKYSEFANKLYTNAKADLDYAVTLAQESNKLIDAAKAAYTAMNDSTNGTGAKKTAKDNAFDAVFTTGNALTTFTNSYNTFVTAFTALDPTGSFVPENVRNAAGQKTDGTNYDYPYVHTNYEELTTLYSQMTGYKTAIDNAITTLNGFAADAEKDILPADIQEQVDIIRNNLANYNTALTQYKTKYANLVNSAITDASISVGLSTAEAKKAQIQSAIDNLGIAKNNADTLNTKSGEYKTAYDAWQAAKEISDAKTDAWETAVGTYNTNVGAARTKYEEDIDLGVNTDHGVDLVAAYSITDREAGGKDPTINNVDVAKTKYADYATISPKTPATADTLNVTLTYTDAKLNDTGTEYVEDNHTDTKTVAEWEEFMNGKATSLATASDGYEDAKLKVATGSTIIINVELDDNYANNWTYDQSTDKTTVASFYLRKILGAGETTERLVKSVQLDRTVTQYSYKNLTFDLNVHLDSAQVTYADDQTTITAEAVTNPPFGMTASVGNDNTTVTWS